MWKPQIARPLLVQYIIQYRYDHTILLNRINWLFPWLYLSPPHYIYIYPPESTKVRKPRCNREFYVLLDITFAHMVFLSTFIDFTLSSSCTLSIGQINMSSLAFLLLEKWATVAEAPFNPPSGFLGHCWSSSFSTSSRFHRIRMINFSLRNSTLAGRQTPILLLSCQFSGIEASKSPLPSDFFPPFQTYLTHFSNFTAFWWSACGWVFTYWI